MKNWGWFILLTLLSLTSCIDEHYTTDPSALLTFSTDTLSFDTVFNEIPSRTRAILVYNKNKKALKIDNITFATGSTSYFRMNIDGNIPSESNSLSDIEIKGKDSLHIFVELTVDKQNQALPVRIEDAILFNFNGNTQKVLLQAYGRDAIIYHSKYIDCDTTLTNERPFIIYDYLYVSEGHSLTLEPGVELYFHADANLIVDGSLISNGTLDEPITMRGDRLDRMVDTSQTPYSYMSGQWGSIYLQNPTSSHQIKNTSIIGGTNGILLLGSSANTPTLHMENSRIHMTSDDGLFSLNGNLTLANCEISCCGKSCLNIIGGRNNITHCTIANYYEWATREEPSLALGNYYTNGNWMYLYPLQSAVFQNTIIFGNMKNEISLNKDTISQQDNPYNIYFSHCYLKTKKISSPQFQNNIWSTIANSTNSKTQELVFMNTTITDNKYYDFTLVKSSAARNAASISVSDYYPDDKNGYNRYADGRPDIGAYEWHP